MWPHILAMISKAQWRTFIDSPVVEWTIFAVGVLLMIAAIPVGALPGPDFHGKDALRNEPLGRASDDPPHDA